MVVRTKLSFYLRAKHEIFLPLPVNTREFGIDPSGTCYIEMGFKQILIFESQEDSDRSLLENNFLENLIFGTQIQNFTDPSIPTTVSAGSDCNYRDEAETQSNFKQVLT